MGTAKAYVFRVYAHSATSYTPSDNFRYAMPENVKRRAITAGLIGGVLFFIVAIIVSVCTVKICNRRKRRKQEQGMISITMNLTSIQTSHSLRKPRPVRKLLFLETKKCTWNQCVTSELGCWEWYLKKILKSSHPHVQLLKILWPWRNVQTLDYNWN